ncbi:DUF7697 family protein [Cereibacter sphaeroides]|nr:Hypothetical Protein RSKD131_4091 [Cereibacter sphaeroides KD131]
MLGWDMSAALSMAAAMGVDARATAEFLPVIEAVMARHLNDQIDGRRESDP